MTDNIVSKEGKERIGLLKYKGVRYSGDVLFTDISDIYHELLEMIELQEVTEEGALELFHDNAQRMVASRLDEITDDRIKEKQQLTDKIRHLAYKAECEGHSPTASYQKACNDIVAILKTTQFKEQCEK